MSSCFFPSALVRELINEAERWAPLETGGVLLGIADEHNVWVEEIVGPGPDAVHSRSEFVPDAAYQQAQIAAAYERAGRRASYLGDWHTHPGQRVYMSQRDRRTLASIARCEPARQPRPVMAILGSTTEWDMIVWRYERPKAGWWRRAQLNELKTVIVVP